MASDTVPLQVILYAFIVLGMKHCVCDFLWQPPYESRFKHLLRHPGAVLHSTKHGLFTFCLLSPPLMAGLLPGLHNSLLMLASLCLMEAILHHAIDYTRARISKRGDYDGAGRPYWILFGIDQYLHQMTYALILYACFRTPA